MIFIKTLGKMLKQVLTLQNRILKRPLQKGENQNLIGIKKS